jgi:cell division protein YceG involved in septum cleavage
MYQCTFRVTVLGLACEKMADRVLVHRQREKDRSDRRTRQETVTIASILEEKTGEEEDTEED